MSDYNFQNITANIYKGGTTWNRSENYQKIGEKQKRITYYSFCDAKQPAIVVILLGNDKPVCPEAVQHLRQWDLMNLMIYLHNLELAQELMIAMRPEWL